MSVKQKYIIATKQKISGYHRKLAWFSFHGNDLYYATSVIIDGSHSSYHKDGSIWRTSPATSKKAKLTKKHYPLCQLQGWFNLDFGMLLKSALCNSPELRNRDQKHQISYVDIDEFPSETLNLVVDLLEPGRQELFLADDMLPPKDAQVIEIKSTDPWLFVTILGHDHNLLVSPYDADFKGITCRHFNKRYSANAPGKRYGFEAYKKD